MASQTPFRLVDGQEFVIPMEYIVLGLRIIVIAEMTDVNVVEEKLSQLVQLEQDCFVASFHQNVEKQRQKVWHDRRIKNKQFQVGGLVLIYDSKFFKHPRKLKTHWLRQYIVKMITDGGTVKLQKLDGTEVKGLVNGSRLKPYHDSSDLVA